MLCWKKEKKSNHGLMALAQGTMAFARANTVILEQTEKDLESEIERENRAPPSSAIGKVRRVGEKVLHSKHVLLVIVLLNVVDCILVMGELILDIYYLKGVLEKSENLGLTFVKDMKTQYPTDLSYLQETDVEKLYSALLIAHIEWGHDTNIHHSTVTSPITTNHYMDPHQKTTTITTDISSSQIVDVNLTTTTSTINIENSTSSLNLTTISSNPGTGRRKRAASKAETDLKDTHASNETDGHHDEHHDDHHDEHHHEHTIEEEIAHAFHKASITILALLFGETLFKIFCRGKHFFSNKLEVFDGLIVMGSFIVDLVFLKGLSGYKIQEFVIILAFLVPWRVIRVVNSLVVAVIDHEHFRMKLMYKQKKQIAGELKDVKGEKKNLERAIEVLKKLAINSGVSEMKINQHLALINQQLKPKKKFSSSSNKDNNKKKERGTSVSSGKSNGSIATIEDSVFLDLSKTTGDKDEAGENGKS